MGREIICKQKGTDDPCSIPIGETVPWHWPNKDAEKEICITLQNRLPEWSCGFAIDQLGDFAVKIPGRPPMHNYICGVQVKFERATFMIIFNPESKEFPPYRIENFTLASVVIGQKVTPTRCH